MSEKSFEEVVVKFFKERFGNKVKSCEVKPRMKSKGLVVVSVSSDVVKEAVISFLNEFDDRGAKLSTISGVDFGKNMGLVYHITVDEEGVVVNVKVDDLSKASPEVDTLSDVIPAAAFMEREVHDLFGIKFRGHPSLKRWVLVETWPEGAYPLRKDFKQGG
ncbi:MAG: hypothetical protein DRJ33_02940 [Candidatus Methanomethylicota archaeon]|uniref:NADH:ubiquinone oxidoreductase 30kDa subunit domain-containing protein n=1 Tax=Thermoproteota archaeon TaxID=2056631 RepID=A0A497EZA1_9CREN|nr:MAG: hypothetical protein DRJ33_02940 [Candidatus Verstraetearchaeota archaeon]